MDEILDGVSFLRFLTDVARKHGYVLRAYSDGSSLEEVSFVVENSRGTRLYEDIHWDECYKSYVQQPRPKIFSTGCKLNPDLWDA